MGIMLYKCFPYKCNKINMNEFWNLISEVEPPIGKNVWTTDNPFVAVPKVRANSWDGARWRNHEWQTLYWADPISRKRDEL
jgi:hypothetical protein